MAGVAHRAAVFLDRRRLTVIGIATLLTVASLIAAKNLQVSTKLEALMPEGAASVLTLNNALEKAGSFASIQVVIEGEDKHAIKSALFILEAVVRPLPWSESVQYFEDISILEQHKLLQLDVGELEKVEMAVEQKMLVATADTFEKNTGIPIRITLTGERASVSSDGKPNDSLHSSLSETIETKRLFASQNGRAQALVIWPKPGHEGLSEAKLMIADVANIIQALDLNAPQDGLRVGIAGRISNKVTQYDAVLRDVSVGLGSSIGLIMLLLAAHYRRVSALMLIMLPLLCGIVWTLGLTALAIGGLNLITIFLALILFGLGIDFGIHNMSRYSEARSGGLSHIEALTLIIGHTGKASLCAALTTSLGFLSLLFTEFRAFREFGFIAGSGVLLILLAMYTVFPALLSLLQGRMRWQPTSRAKASRKTYWLAGRNKSFPTVIAALLIVIAAGMLAFGIEFERNFRNIQADKSPDQQWATAVSKSIFRGGHDRAVLVVGTLEEVEAIETYFKNYVAQDTETPTISKIVSLRNFIPNPTVQAERLEVINRMWETLGEGGPLPDDLADKTQYLQIDELKPDELPPAMRRVFIGNEDKPGYLMYIYNSVSMDDAYLARQFYEDAAAFTVNGTTYFPASEAFIFVEMLALMKSDAVRAVVLVLVVTTAMIFAFTRSTIGTIQILTPTLAGLTITLAVMALVDLRLSIINMVILPSLIGISVDNGIHIFERFRNTGEHIAEVMATTGRAATITTLTTLVGFGGLVSASMGGLRSMGYLALIGFSICLVMTWLLLPALLQLRRPSNTDGHITSRKAKPV